MMQSPNFVNGTGTEDEACDCNHYWVIESPNGPTSQGRCRQCGELREFKNSVQVTSWESDGNRLHRAKGEVASRRA